jgi:hypothetical protein
VNPEGREVRCFAFNSLLMALNETESSRGYSSWYPKNSRSLSTFSCLTNTVMRRREALPFLSAGLRYIRLILKASLRLTSTVSHRTGRSSSF